MSKLTASKIRQLKQKSIFPSVLSFLFILMLGIILMAGIIAAVIGYITESRFFEERVHSNRILEQIESEYISGKSPDDILSSIQTDANAPKAISIYSNNNQCLAFYGEELDRSDNRIVSENPDIRISLSLDKTKAALASNNVLQLNLIDIVSNVLEVFESNTINGDFYDLLTNEILRYSYWIDCPWESQDAHVYIKCEQYLYLNDCYIIAIIIGISFFLFLILSSIAFIHELCTIHAQRYLVNLLLKDNVTEGRNYLSFIASATKTLAKYKKNEFALVDLSIIKYQNFCTLHGTSEGEKILTTLEYVLSLCLTKADLYARVANGDYILLLRNPGNAAPNQFLTDKMNQILSELPHKMLPILQRKGVDIKDSNSIKFKAGLYTINPALDSASKNLRKKKNIDIDRLYLKAGMAKQVVGDEGGLSVYSHDMWEKELWEQKVEAQMQQALEREEFQVYIQPKYHPSTEELVGGEALVRWISPTEGFISPGKFIPIFEKTGFITKLDDYMISHTAALQAKWLSEGKKIVPISINVSRAHFSKPDLAEHIRNLVNQYPLPHEYIEIELTESAFFDDKNALLSTVKRLQEYGFEVSMDDFGSGYSSLNSLKDLPLNVLKLDAEFFRGDDFDTRGEIVVSQAIALAKRLDMRIVAEGIEKKEQVDFLASQNCDMIQGFYFDKPMPANEYVTRMK